MEELEKLLDDLETANFDKGVAMSFGKEAAPYYSLCDDIRKKIRELLNNSNK